MIYIHTYNTGKFNTVKHVRVYEDFKEAFDQQMVLGETIKWCEVVKEC